MPFATATDGVRVHYEVIGFRRNPPVLFVQGLGAEKNSWNLQRAALALRWRTIALDNRGAGRSDKPEGTYDLEQMAEDAIAVLDHAGIESAHVVGLSMGGAISQIIALKHPNRVRSLTLVATACRNHEWREELLQSWADVAATEGMGAVGREALHWARHNVRAAQAPSPLPSSCLGRKNSMSRSVRRLPGPISMRRRIR